MELLDAEFSIARCRAFRKYLTELDEPTIGDVIALVDEEGLDLDRDGDPRVSGDLRLSKLLDVLGLPHECPLDAPLARPLFGVPLVRLIELIGEDPGAA